MLNLLDVYILNRRKKCVFKIIQLEKLNKITQKKEV